MSFSTSDVVGTLNSRFSFEQEVNIKKVNIAYLYKINCL